MEDPRLLEIVTKERDDSSILSDAETTDLRKSYTRYHPQRIQWFYQIVKDFADHKSLELIMDKAWTFELSMHKPKEQADAALKQYCKK